MKLLQKPESLWLEQLILPCSHTSLLFLCHRIWESHRCSLHSGPEVPLLLHLWVGGGFQSDVVIGFGWGGWAWCCVFSDYVFSAVFSVYFHCPCVLLGSLLKCIHTDKNRLQRMFWSFWSPLSSPELYWCRLLYLDVEEHVSCASSNLQVHLVCSICVFLALFITGTVEWAQILLGVTQINSTPIIESLHGFITNCCSCEWFHTLMRSMRLNSVTMVLFLINSTSKLVISQCRFLSLWSVDKLVNGKLIS